MTVEAVKVLVVEPIWNNVSASTGDGASTLVIPKPPAWARPLWGTPTANPGHPRRTRPLHHRPGELGQLLVQAGRLEPLRCGLGGDHGCPPREAVMLPRAAGRVFGTPGQSRRRELCPATKLEGHVVTPATTT